jgi:2-amino-4-hydroxy-6-hydroxymethyldihydropteridine diphosphokinase
MVECYIGLGGNHPDTCAALRKALSCLKQEPGISQVTCSGLYVTTPVGDVQQPDFFNAVCRFQTALSLLKVWNLLETVTRELGQMPKPKNAPRLIDLDLLFYGSLISYTDRWTIPHPRWQERLFVLRPLSDVAEELPFGVKPKDLLARFSNPHQERVTLINTRLDDNALN